MFQNNSSFQGGEEYGGVDPGLKSTRVILEQTYNDNRRSEDGVYLVPDQLIVETNDTCTNETRKRVIAGSLTYQRELLIEIGFGTANGKKTRRYNYYLTKLMPGFLNTNRTRDGLK